MRVQKLKLLSQNIFVFQLKKKKILLNKPSMHYHPPLGDDKLFSVPRSGCTEIILPSLTGELCGTWSCLSK